MQRACAWATHAGLPGAKHREEGQERCQCCAEEWGLNRKEVEATWGKWVRGDAGGGTGASEVQGAEGNVSPTSPYLPPSGVSTGSQWVQGEGPWLLAHATLMW